MKLAVALICLLPLAFCAPVEERDLNDFFNTVLGVFGLDINQLKVLLTGLVAVLETDATEQQCELACVPIAQGLFENEIADLLLPSLCPLVCKSFQTLVHQLNVQVGK